MKQIGKTTLYTAPIVFGGNIFGWTLNEKESFRILDEVYDKGFNTIDTADVYSRWAEGNTGGESENIIGKWVKERKLRDKIVIGTKVGSNMKPGGEKNISKEYILKAVEDSLRRLKTDYIDLYSTHWDDKKTPVEETLEAYQKLIKDGKVRFIGASNLSPERLKASLEAANSNGLPKYEVFQPEYNLVARSKYENGIQEICTENNLGVTPYFSLASGFLTGKYEDEKDVEGEDRKAFVKNYMNERGWKILSVVENIAKEQGVSHAAVSLAWLMQRPGITAPIASATKSSHLKAFQEAVQLKLSKEEINNLTQAGA